MSHTTGGQRRTIVTNCGWTSKGSVREANGKMRLHLKVCKICKSFDNSGDIAEYNKDNAMKNGWNGITEKGAVKNTIVTTLEKDDSQDINLSGNVTSNSELFHILGNNGLLEILKNLP